MFISESNAARVIRPVFKIVNTLMSISLKTRCAKDHATNSTFDFMYSTTVSSEIFTTFILQIVDIRVISEFLNSRASTSVVYKLIVILYL